MTCPMGGGWRAGGPARRRSIRDHGSPIRLAAAHGTARACRLRATWQASGWPSPARSTLFPGLRAPLPQPSRPPDAVAAAGERARAGARRAGAWARGLSPWSHRNGPILSVLTWPHRAGTVSATMSTAPYNTNPLVRVHRRTTGVARAGGFRSRPRSASRPSR